MNDMDKIDLARNGLAEAIDKDQAKVLAEAIADFENRFEKVEHTTMCHPDLVMGFIGGVVADGDCAGTLSLDYDEAVKLWLRAVNEYADMRWCEFHKSNRKSHPGGIPVIRSTLLWRCKPEVDRITLFSWSNVVSPQSSYEPIYFYRVYSRFAIINQRWHRLDSNERAHDNNALLNAIGKL